MYNIVNHPKEFYFENKIIVVKNAEDITWLAYLFNRTESKITSDLKDLGC